MSGADSAVLAEALRALQTAKVHSALRDNADAVARISSAASALEAALSGASALTGADSEVGSSDVARREWFFGQETPQRCAYAPPTTNAAIRASGLGSSSPVLGPAARTSPVVHDPSNAFDQMATVLNRNIFYVESVTSAAFNILAIKDFNGETMVDDERLFLVVCCSVLAHFTLLETLQVDKEKLVHFLKDLFTHFNGRNPFHSARRAADALQMVLLVFLDPSIAMLFTDDEILAVLMAVLCSDLAHCGVSDAFLERIWHPYALLFNGPSPTADASLTVLMHLLHREENYFLAWPQVGVVEESTDGVRLLLLQELIQDAVVGSAPVNRPSLLDALQRLGTSGQVMGSDIHTLVKALTLLATNAFTFRPRTQHLELGQGLLEELFTQGQEEQRRGMASAMTMALMDDLADRGAIVLEDYLHGLILPVYRATALLIPRELGAQLQRNVDMYALLRSDSGSAEDGRPTAAPVDFTLSELKWVDDCHMTMNVLKRIISHGVSLDRKASKHAILNATPQRSVTAPLEMSLIGMMDGILESSIVAKSTTGLSVPCNVSDPAMATPARSAMTGFGGSVVHMGASGSVATVNFATAGSPLKRQNRSEHYFSFLRLFDLFEMENRSVEEFDSHLLFLALQLDPSYIGAYMWQNQSLPNSVQECVAIAQLVAQTEEAPRSGESIASPSQRTEQSTDPFILQLMEMYRKRALMAPSTAPATALTSLTSHGDMGDALLPTYATTTSNTVTSSIQRLEKGLGAGAAVADTASAAGRATAASAGEYGSTGSSQVSPRRRRIPCDNPIYSNFTTPSSTD